MRRSSSILGVVAGLVFFSGGLRAEDLGSDEAIIRETESLRNSLSIADPSRLPLTLRLADLLMDQASRSAQQKSKLQSRALALYDEALKERIQGGARIKIDFQRARLMSDLGQVEASVVLWKSLAQQKDFPEISREAALRLAESGDVRNAERWYEQALQLCSGGDLCSYIRFKRAWLFRQAAKSGLADDRAIAEMELALWDSKGRVREESLRDLLVFLGEKRNSDETSFRQSLAKVESFAQRLDRPALVADLAEAYFVAGNKAGGTFVLAQAQRKDPKFARLVRLAEEHYGARDWNAFALSLDSLSEGRTAEVFLASSSIEQMEAEKILRRLVIQLDGERISQKERTSDFQKASLAYLRYYPASPEKLKFQEGWLASESDSQRKLDQLAKWIELDPSSVRLREFRASIAQKMGLSAVVVSDMAALAGSSPQSAKSREYLYLQARAHYEAKEWDSALSLFQSLARVEGQSTPDSWGIQAQNLALDILNQKKNWDALIAQAGSWLDASWAKTASVSLQKELSDIAEIRKQARFERAVSLGESAHALAEFVSFCGEGLYREKSCENARVLSVKLKNQEVLLQVLEKMGPSRQLELAQEVEASGYFSRAAQLLEQLSPIHKKRDAALALKIALLWELSADESSFGRAVTAIRQAKLALSDQQESLWLMMAFDLASKNPQMLDRTTFSFLRNERSRAQLAEWFETQGRGSPESQKILLQSSFETGPGWSKLVQSEIENGVKRAQAISFYGRQSRAQFEKRLSAMVRVSKRADEIFPKAEPQTKGAIALVLKKAYEDFAQEIRNSPIPAGVPESAVPELKAGLEEMAKPFDEKARVYAQVPASSAGGVESDRLVISSAQARAVPAVMASIDQALTELHRNPEAREALASLRDSYGSLGKPRLAGYFEGRFNSTGGGK